MILFSYMFGWVASIITITYKIPQIINIYKIKQINGISIYSYILQTCGYIFYGIHGYFNNDIPILIMGVISFIENLIIMIMYYCYKNNNT
jgi:uncharacterized protein with PQ loop repeat